VAGVPRPGSLGLRVWNAITTVNTVAYRRTGGRLGGRWKRRNPILLLEHTGRRSGQRRTTPLVYTRDGDDLVVVASRGGSEANPAWFHTLRANPSARVQLGRERLDVAARVADPAERERLWPKLVKANPDYGTYEKRTSREVPVVILRPERQPPGGAGGSGP
jgi:deazaflavin-dependent oxidoreductase (nitroreductase family)